MIPFDFDDCFCTLGLGGPKSWKCISDYIREDSLLFQQRWEKESFTMEAFLLELGISQDSVAELLVVLRERDITTPKDIGFLSKQDSREISPKIGPRIKLLHGMAICRFLMHKGLF